MHVGIDISSLSYQRGVSRYTTNLVQALFKHKSVRLHLYGSSLRKKTQLKKSLQQLNPPTTGHQVKLQSWPPTILAWLWKFNLNPIKKIWPKLDVFHSWDWLQPPDKDLPLVSTIHDLAILRFPETAHPQVLKMHQRSWKILKEREAEVIAVSKATKKDIVKYLDIPPWKIHVVPEALPVEIQHVSEQLTDDDYQLIKQKLKLSQPYLLFVGTREPRKNLVNLIEAWKPLAADCQLIVAGDHGWDQTSQQPQLFKHPQLRFLGQVTDQELTVLYGEADCLVYPSLYEGFGLPILEAFYHGTPVVAANIPAIIEVGGNAVEYVDPDSLENIRSGVEKVLNESISKQQKRLQRMIIRLQMFSWDQVARQTIQVYRQAVANQAELKHE